MIRTLKIIFCNDMTLHISVALFSIFLQFRSVDGSQCVNPFDMLYKEKGIDIEYLLKKIIGPSFESNTMFYTEDFINAKEDCKMITSCRIELLFQDKNKLELCFSTKQKECFLLSCMCSKDNKTADGLNPSSGDFKCIPEKKEKLNACDKEKKQINATNKKVKDNPENIHTTTIESNKQSGSCNESTGIGPNLQNKERLQPLALTVSFILGTIVGSVVSIFTIHLCRSRKLRQIQNHQQAELYKDMPQHMKGNGETSEYSEILEDSRSKEMIGAGLQIGEYLEPLSKNNTVSKATIPLENLYGKDETNQYHELILERGYTNQDIYNHTRPNHGTYHHVPNTTKVSCDDTVYHTLALNEIDEKIGLDSDSKLCDPVPNLLNDHHSTNSEMHISNHIEGDEIPNERPYSICKNARKLREKLETDEAPEEINEKSNIDKTYFVLQKSNC